ncbi:type II/IV secretion system protein [Candidatus Roizmanbacteria bacterium]|nr:type II/IV secretion system protein [Candidatus Roizmanbacteria bacterium]
MNIAPKHILSILVSQGAISQDSANQFELDALNKNIPIDEYLFNDSGLKKNVVLSAISTLYNVPSIDVTSAAIDPQALGLISESIAQKYTIIPIAYEPKTNSLTIVTADPFNITLSDFLEKKTGKRIVFALGYFEDIKKSLALAYAQSLSPEVKEALQEVNTGAPVAAAEELGTVIREAPIAKILSTILEFAVKSRASDIHIEPQENKVRVRYRIDGILQEKLSLPKGIQDALISRTKILSEMKIDEKRIPQDGRFTYRLGVEEVDLRVSTLPTVHGEKIVMRLLKKTGGLPTLADLGLRGPQLKDMEEAISRPYGIVLVTGPTGSGKTTTLYSVLTRLNKPGVNIMTLEDPVEYQIQGINQVQINPQAGLTFATGLRAFLRQDPNIILVGEIRDKETTQLAIQAALTGHLVFSTLHTNDAATAIPRLLDLGGEPFLIASVLNAALGQRIIRKICDFCKTFYEPPEEIQKSIRDSLADLLPLKYKTQPIRLAKGNGCKECAGTGYIARIAIYEVLKVTPTINKMILRSASGTEIETEAKNEGLISMKQDGYLKVLDGITTIEEVLRVAEE